ncbi:MAG TPA: CHAP domain-containing protein [Anaerolineae bacterium]|nr:CHAP domain-containing protein [Anaerolineae bacterium]
MRKLKFLSALVLLVVLLGIQQTGFFTQGSALSQVSAAARSSCRSNSPSAILSSQPISDWQRYTDQDYGFSFEYPAGWKVEMTIQQTAPFPEPSAIIKRQTLMGPEGMIDLDVWLANGHDLNGWLEWHEATRDKLSLFHPNATIAGQTAVVSVDKGVTVDMLTVFFSAGKYIYRLWYTVSRHERGLQAYWHILSTFTLPRSTSATAQIPENVRQDADQVVEASAIDGVLVTSCCGYNSPGNPFPCCGALGNCTWWVYYSYGAVPFRGDAGTWWSQVPNYPDWSRSTTTPRKNQWNIAWWSGSPGHVAHAPNYTGGNTIYITEMSWCTTCRHSRTINLTDANGYIFEKYPPQPRSPSTDPSPLTK